jgi:8-oxo-dGTP pyrophosphatase MutT (NUDIX family)
VTRGQLPPDPDAWPLGPLPERFHPKPGDGFVACTCPAGRHWGLLGAAGLLVYAPERDAVALQLRSSRAHEGGTWALPGGAIMPGESPLEAALREASEESLIDARMVEPVWWHVADHGPWAYTTAVARAGAGFEMGIGDRESLGIEWVPVAEVTGRRLHSGFAAAWPQLAGRLEARLTVVVDCANVVGSRPDGWWRDRAGAARRLRGRLEPLATGGIPGATIGWPEFGGFWPTVELVVEGQAGPVAADRYDGPVHVERAPRDGDSHIVARVSAAIGRGDIAVAVTADRELRGRVERAGGTSVGPGWLRHSLG